MRNMAFLAALALAATQTAVAAQTVNAQSNTQSLMSVQSLMGDGYTIAGVTQPPGGGAGVFLLKGNALVFCFVAETPDSPTVATKYCKPVR